MSKRPYEMIAKDYKNYDMSLFFTNPISMHYFLPQASILLPRMNEKQNAPTGLKLNIYPVIEADNPAFSSASGG